MNIDNYTTIHDLYFDELDTDNETNELTNLNCKQLTNLKHYYSLIKDGTKMTKQQNDIFKKFNNQLWEEYDATYRSANHKDAEIHEKIRIKEINLFKQKCKQINANKNKIIEEIDKLLEQKKLQSKKENYENNIKKIQCKCGGQTCQKNWSIHCKTQKHQNYVKAFGDVKPPTYKKDKIEYKPVTKILAVSLPIKERNTPKIEEPVSLPIEIIDEPKVETKIELIVEELNPIIEEENISCEDELSETDEEEEQSESDEEEEEEYIPEFTIKKNYVYTEFGPIILEDDEYIEKDQFGCSYVAKLSDKPKIKKPIFI